MAFASKAKIAEELAAKRADRTEVHDVTLPIAYRSLGKAIYSEGPFQQEFKDLLAEIKIILESNASLKQDSSQQRNPTLSAESKALAARADRELERLGKAAYEKHGQRAGTSDLVAPITYDLVRVALLDSEIETLEHALAEHVVTPRRIVIGIGGGIVLFLLLGLWSMFGGGNPNHRGSRDSETAAASSDATQNAGARIPVPDEAKQQEAAQQVQAEYGARIDGAKTPDARKELVAKLLADASDADTAPEQRYALLHTALKLAPDATVALEVVDETAETFEIDAFQAKAAQVGRLSKSASTATEKGSVASAASALMDQASARDNFDAALILGGVAADAAQKAGATDMLQEIQAKTAQARRWREDFPTVKRALAVLEKHPSDAKANTIVGTYRCFVRGDWERGLPMLAICSDAALRKLAGQEMQRPSNSIGQLALGDGWFGLAEKSNPRANQEAMYGRAEFWYRLSLKSKPPVSRPARESIEKRLREIAAQESR